MTNQPASQPTALDSKSQVEYTEPPAENDIASEESQPRKGGASHSSRSTRMLYLHPTHRLLGGVCGGLAEYLDLDPVLVRILWLVATIITGGGGLLAYGVLWLLLPVGSNQHGQVKPAAIALNERNMARVAFTLIALGIAWLLANLGVIPWLWSGFWAVMGTVFWPALLVGAGYLMLRSRHTPAADRGIGERASELRDKLFRSAPDREQIKEGLRTAQQRIPIRRNPNDRVFWGVCGGLARSLRIDANLIRLIWAAFSIGSLGTGVLIYIVVGLLLPEDDVTTLSASDDQRQEIHILDGTVNNSA